MYEHDINRWKKSQFDNTSAIFNLYNFKIFICTFWLYFWIILSKKYKNVIAVNSQKMPAKWKSIMIVTKISMIRNCITTDVTIHIVQLERDKKEEKQRDSKNNGCKPENPKTHVKKQTLSQIINIWYITDKYLQYLM